MKANCSVTFEFNNNPSKTWFGEIEGSSPSTLARKAMSHANKKLRPRRWISFTCVIIDRTLDGADGKNENQDV